jgi:hypothetical protein
MRSRSTPWPPSSASTPPATRRPSERLAHERDERIRRRLLRVQESERHGWRRFHPGPSRDLYSPGMLGTASHWAPASDEELDGEIDAIARALDERGPTDRDNLYQAVGARYWGRFRGALNAAVLEGRVRRLSRDTFAPAEPARAPAER